MNRTEECWRQHTPPLTDTQGWGYSARPACLPGLILSGPLALGALHFSFLIGCQLWR